jgi:hypothetical protein
VIISHDFLTSSDLVTSDAALCWSASAAVRDRLARRRGRPGGVGNLDDPPDQHGVGASMGEHQGRSRSGAAGTPTSVAPPGGWCGAGRRSPGWPLEPGGELRRPCAGHAVSTRTATAVPTDFVTWCVRGRLPSRNGAALTLRRPRAGPAGRLSSLTTTAGPGTGPHRGCPEAAARRPVRAATARQLDGTAT